MEIHANTKLYKETEETVETNGDTCNYKTVWKDRKRLKETKETVETVETSGDTYKYKIVWNDRERLKETKGD